MLEERLDSGTDAERQHIWGPQYIDQLILRDRDADANGSLEERLYGLQDANWNVTGLAETGGSAVERYLYKPYGEVVFMNGSFEASFSSVDNPYVFTGRNSDSETGVYYYRNRYYDASLGRFISRDPIEAHPNLYEYVFSQPTRLLDPTGLWPWYVLCRRARVSCGRCFLHCEINNTCKPGWQMVDGELEYHSCFPVLQHVPPKRTLPDGTPCANATEAQIDECLNKHFPTLAGGGVWGDNCQANTIKAIQLCCVKTTWNPSLLAGPLRGKCLRKKQLHLGGCREAIYEFPDADCFYTEPNTDIETWIGRCVIPIGW